MKQNLKNLRTILKSSGVDINDQDSLLDFSILVNDRSVIVESAGAGPNGHPAIFIGRYEKGTEFPSYETSLGLEIVNGEMYPFSFTDISGLLEAYTVNEALKVSEVHRQTRADICTAAKEFDSTIGTEI